jgi:HD-GYP domain-containing protein (c-di-GMP phosphodiesterase class II)
MLPGPEEFDLPQAILIVGDAAVAETARQYLALGCDPALPVKVHSSIADAASLLASDPDIALILLLWQGSDAQALPSLVQSLLEQPARSPRAVMVRSLGLLPATVCAALWQLGVADRSFHQALNSTELVDSVVVALRHHQQQLSSAQIPRLSRVFSGATNLRELAHLSLQSIHKNRLPVCDGLFCFLDNTPAAQAMVIAGTGRHTNIACMALEKLAHSKASILSTLALDQRRSQLLEDEVALFLLTPNGFAACLYFALDAPLHASQRGLLATISDLTATAIDQAQLAHRLLRTQQATINTLSELAEYRDVDTGEHVARVARMTTEIAQILSQQPGQAVSPRLLSQIGLASILHDTGKIGIGDDILLKPGPLCADERLAMQQHVIYGHRILMRAAQRTVDSELLTLSAQIARHHHERFDGAGYPDGLQGDAIPLAARIVALVDVYDALTSQRPYSRRVRPSFRPPSGRCLPSARRVQNIGAPDRVEPGHVGQP